MKKLGWVGGLVTESSPGLSFGDIVEGGVTG